MEVAGQCCFTPGKEPGAHCTGGWVGPSTSVDKCAEEKNLLTPVEVQTSNCPACSKPLHLVGYSVPGRVDTLCACLKTDGVSLSNILQITVF